MHLNRLFIYYSIVGLALIAILFTNPFLRYPYDMIHHLIVMDDFYVQLTNPIQEVVGIFVNDIYIMIPTGEDKAIELSSPRYLWHYMWSILFYLLHIDSTQMVLRAKIIHVVQVYISLFSLYYFSKVVIRNIFVNINSIILKWLSVWSVVIWLTIFATASVAYHQVWIMWYSVNYQITLPLFWYITALTLVLFLEKTSPKKKIFFILQILILSRFILQAHSMEFMYYLMYLSVFSLIFIDKIVYYFKIYFYMLLPLVGGMYYFIINYQPEQSKIFDYLSLTKLPELYQKIMHEGNILIHGYNRATASINDLMYFIGTLSIIFVIYLIWQKYKNKEIDINIRMLFFIGLTSLFVLIPLYQFSGGLFAVITKTMVLNRLYYSSSLFVLLPIFIFYFTKIYNIKFKYTHIIILVSLITVGIFSKYNNTFSHNYYKNINSIKNSFYKRKVSFNLNQKQIETIGNKIAQYEQSNPTHKKNFYYARADIAFVLKYIYKRNVCWKGRRSNPDYMKIYKENKNYTDYTPILFEIPENFPPYKPYL